MVPPKSIYDLSRDYGGAMLHQQSKDILREAFAKINGRKIPQVKSSSSNRHKMHYSIYRSSAAVPGASSKTARR